MKLESGGSVLTIAGSTNRYSFNCQKEIFAWKDLPLTGKFACGILRVCHEHYAECRGHNVEAPVSKFQFLTGHS